MKILYQYNRYRYQYLITMLLIVFYAWPFKMVNAQNAECAEVKVVIEQKLSFERQAFDAKMVINNGLTSSELKNIKVELVFEDQNNQPVIVTEDPNATNAKFFYKVDSMSNIESITGSGQIASKSSAEIHWLIIPSFGAAENKDTLYYVGAKVTYTLNDVETSVDVTPDYIVVRPLPKLTLDYFFPEDVYADDPFTAETELAVPFTLGVRIKNSGYGVAGNTVIESAQPKIVENKQNLLVNFEILGGYVSDELVGKSLLLKFGNIESKASKIGRWKMVTSLAGKFVEFSASYSHADGLGGALTSLIDEIKTHTLIQDVKVDLAGRDNIRDFLAKDIDTLRVYESEGTDSIVVDQSTKASLQAKNGQHEISFPATTGFAYVHLTDPFNGARAPLNVKRSDGKVIPAENMWLSKTRNEDLSWAYFINLFDVNSTGIYTLSFTENTAKASLSGFVYNDANDNGVKDSAEAGVGVAGVTLKGIDEDGLKVSSDAYTDAKGEFKFVGINPGNYSLQAMPIAGMNNGTASSEVAGTTTEQGKINDLSLTAGMQATNNLFAKVSGEVELPKVDTADLEIALITSLKTATVGETVKFIATLKNNGPDEAINTAVDLTIPKNLRLFLVNASAGKVTNKNGRWVIDKIAANTSYTLEMSTKVMQATGNIAVTTSISNQVEDSNIANNTATVTVLTVASMAEK